MAKIFYNFDISESENGFSVFENGKLQHMVGEIKNETELDLWLEDHASIRGLCPDNYKLNFLPIPLKSDEILNRTTKICEKVKSFKNLKLDMNALNIFSKFVVELNEWKRELEGIQETGENFATRESCIVILNFYIDSWNAMIRYVSKKYIL